jgi:hypothetical protein
MRTLATITAALLFAAAPALRAGDAEPGKPAAPPKPAGKGLTLILSNGDNGVQLLIDGEKVQWPAPGQSLGPDVERIIQEIRERVKVETEKAQEAVKEGETRLHKLMLDNREILKALGDKLKCQIQIEGDAKALPGAPPGEMRVTIDGKEVARVPFPNVTQALKRLPPLAFPNLDGVSTRVESRTVNGVSRTQVWVDGKPVYDGPGGNSSSTIVSEADGRKFVEVKVDGRVVYKAGEQPGAPAPRSDKKAE